MRQRLLHHILSPILQLTGYLAKETFHFLTRPRRGRHFSVSLATPKSSKRQRITSRSSDYSILTLMMQVYQDQHHIAESTFRTCHPQFARLVLQSWAVYSVRPINSYCCKTRCRSQHRFRILRSLSSSTRYTLLSDPIHIAESKIWNASLSGYATTQVDPYSTFIPAQRHGWISFVAQISDGSHWVSCGAPSRLCQTLSILSRMLNSTRQGSRHHQHLPCHSWHDASSWHKTSPKEMTC